LNCHKEEDIQFSGCQNLWHPSEAYKLFDHNNHYTSTLISLLLPLLTRHLFFFNADSNEKMSSLLSMD
jgi:hypothetical protein